MKFRYLLLFLLLFANVFGASNLTDEITLPSGTSHLQRLASTEYPSFADDLEFINLDIGISQSIAYLSKLPKNRVFRFGSDEFTVDHMVRSLTYFSNFIKIFPTEIELKRFLQAFFLIYKSSPRQGSVLFTAYCEPLIRGSRVKTSQYPIGVYSAPSDIAYKKNSAGRLIIGRYDKNGKFVKYYSREELDRLKILETRAKPIVFVASKVDRLFMEIEGSGRILLDDGEILHLAYLTKNGHTYRSIGKFLLDSGLLPPSQISMSGIRQFLESNPDSMQKILNHNPSFVFFQKGSGRAIGSLAVELTAGRSLATDKRLFPQGALAFIKTKKPQLDQNSEVKNWDNLNRFVLNQDTGGAIKGAHRGDIFFGSGEYAEVAASSLKHPGEMYFLILNPKANLYEVNRNFTSQR